MPKKLFEKGNPGRRFGSKNKRGLEIRALASRFLLDREYLVSLAERLKNGTAPHMEKFFAEHLWGKPKERFEVTTVDPTVLRLIVVEERDAISYANSSGNGHNGNGDGHPIIDITPPKEPDEGGS